jgi:hypothetical protein
MPNQAFENMEKVCELSLETARRLGGWNTRLCDKLAEQQLAGMALWVDAGIKQLRLLGESQNPYDIYAGQTQLAQEYAERVSECVRQTLALLVNVQNDLSGVFRPAVTETRAVMVSSQAPDQALPGVEKAKTVDRPQQ